MSTRGWIATSLVMALLLAGAPAAWAQLDARDRPAVRGPLRVAIKRCRTRDIRFDGSVVGVARSCIRLYRLRPSVDGHAARDHGAVWLQVTVDPRRRWCSERVRSDIDVPAEARMHARAPRSRVTNRRRTVRTRLTVDAQGRAERPGTIRQRFGLLPRALRTSTRSGGDVWRAAWRGSTAATVAIASGIEISWPAGAPPQQVTSNLAFELQRKRSC